MSQNSNRRSATTLVIALPEHVFARGGASFDPRSDLWEWADGPFNARIDFRRYSDGFTVFVPMLKQALLPFVKGYSSAHVMGLNDSFVQFAKVIGTWPGGQIGAQHISDYKAKLGAHKVGILGKLNTLLQKWVALRLPGVEPECAAYLQEQRKPRYKKGNAVRTRDPIKGPLSEEEYTALYSAVNAAYGRGRNVSMILKHLVECVRV